ncbi:hypothetical protein PCYB_002520, partial [Plasmodium cynomolgi strain B]
LSKPPSIKTGVSKGDGNEVGMNPPSGVIAKEKVQNDSKGESKKELSQGEENKVDAEVEKGHSASPNSEVKNGGGIKMVASEKVPLKLNNMVMKKALLGKMLAKRVPNGASSVEGEKQKGGEAAEKGKENKEGEAAVKEKDNKEGEAAEKGKENKEGEAVEQEKDNKEGEAAEKDNNEGEAVEQEKDDKEGEAVEQEKDDKEGEAVEQEKDDKEGEAVEQEKEKPTGKTIPKSIPKGKAGIPKMIPLKGLPLKGSPILKAKAGMVPDGKGSGERLSLKGSSERLSLNGSLERLSLKGSSERLSLKGSGERFSLKGSLERLSLKGSGERLSLKKSLERLSLKKSVSFKGVAAEGKAAEENAAEEKVAKDNSAEEKVPPQVSAPTVKSVRDVKSTKTDEGVPKGDNNLSERGGFIEKAVRKNIERILERTECLIVHDGGEKNGKEPSLGKNGAAGGPKGLDVKKGKKGKESRGTALRGRKASTVKGSGGDARSDAGGAAGGDTGSDVPPTEGRKRYSVTLNKFSKRIEVKKKKSVDVVELLSALDEKSGKEDCSVRSGNRGGDAIAESSTEGVQKDVQNESPCRNDVEEVTPSSVNTADESPKKTLMIKKNC